MQIDYRFCWDEKGSISWERGKLGGKKLVNETFPHGSISGYHYEPYSLINAETIKEHPFFRYCGYFDEWEYRPFGPRGYPYLHTDLVNYLTLYSIYPRQVEMFAKMGYFEPIEDMIYRRKRNAAVMNWDETDPRKAFGLDKGELNHLLAAHIPLAVLEIKRTVKKVWDENWPLDFCNEFMAMWGGVSGKDVLHFVKKHGIGIRPFYNYIARQDGVRFGDIFELYKDYIEMTYNLGCCMEHGEVLFPKDLSAAHDRVAAEWEKRCTERDKALKKTQKVSLATRKQKYEFEADGLCVVFPMSAQEIKREGKLLKHCVGGYADRHMKDVLSIVFLRRADRRHIPLVTIEMHGNKVQQIHGWDNERTPCRDNPSQKPPRDIYRDFLDKWVKWLVAGSKRNEDGTPKLPRERKARKTA